MERFNYEINMRVLVPFRRLINYMERRGLLDKDTPAHVCAFSALAQPLVQYGCDLLLAAWNEHSRAGVRSRGRQLPGSGGVPSERMRMYPHPGGQLRLPQGLDGVEEYEHVSCEGLPRMSEALKADACHCPGGGRRQRRHSHIAYIMGDVEHAWIRLQRSSFSHFAHAYSVYLSYYI